MGGRDHPEKSTGKKAQAERTPRYHVGRARVVERLSPTMMRVVVEGLPGFPTRCAVGETLRVVLPDPETGRVPEPDLTGGKPRWAKSAPLTRKYTVRRVEPERGTVEIAVVAHGRGPGSRWAQGLTPGDPVHLLGPKSGRETPEPGRFLLMVGDETGLPGIARWLEQLPADAVGRVILEVPGSGSLQDLTAPAGVRLTWLVPDGRQSGARDGLDGEGGRRGGVLSAPAGPAGDARAGEGGSAGSPGSAGGGEPGAAEVLAGSDVLEVVQRMPVPEGPVFAWLAGESTVLRPVRRFLMERWGLDKRSMHAKGYWNRRD